MDEAYQQSYDPSQGAEEEDDEMGVNQPTEEDYGEEANTETDAYEVMVQQ